MRFGCLLPPESFAWSSRGLLRVAEICRGDRILGLDTVSNLCWIEVLQDCERESASTTLRILTDANEFCVPAFSKIATLDGLKSAEEIGPDDRIEIFNRMDGFKLIYESLLQRPPELVTVDRNRKVEVDASIAYVLGTQLLARRYDYKVVMGVYNQEHWTELAGIFNTALRKAGISGKVFYARMAGMRVVINSPPFAHFVNGILSDNFLPQVMRTSRPDILLEFFRGIMDSLLRPAGKNLAKLVVQDALHELRRFVLVLGKMFQLVPFRISTGEGSGHMREATLYFRISDLLKLNLRNIHLTYCEVPPIPEVRKDYAQARAVRKFRNREVNFLEYGSIHVAPVIDLVSVQPQRIW